MALRRLLQVFSTMMVKTYDLDWLRDIITDQVMTRMAEITQQKGVIQTSGADFVATEVDGDVEIGTGRGYVDGERVEIEVAETVALTEGDDVVISIAHATEADADPHATRLDDIGGAHTVWYRDGYSLEKTEYATWIAEPPDAKIALWRAQKTGGEVTLTDMRTYLTLGLPLPDGSILTAWLANLAVTNAKIANRAVNSGKIALLGVAEENLAAGTDMVPLYLDRQDEPVAGDKVTPGSHVFHDCAIGGVYEYKIFGPVLWEDADGPIRRLRLRCLLGSPGSGEVYVALVAWTDTPASYDPEDPSYDGLVDSVALTNPAPDTPVELELDLTVSLDPADDGILKYGLVLRNSTDQAFGVYDIRLVGIR